MANPTKSAALRRAQSGMGFGEVPHGSNRTKFNRWFYGHDQAAAWCAIYVCWVLIGAGFNFPKNDGADELAAQQVSRGWKKISKQNIDSGDIVLFMISHVGFCKSRLSGGGKRVYEGNHSNDVCTVDRGLSIIRYGVRPPYSPETVTPHIEAGVPAAATPNHTKYVVHGNANHDSGRLTNANGWETWLPSPPVGDIVYPAPELGSEYEDCQCNKWIPIKWGIHSGWYRADFLQWAD